jgi:hypothetical protein
VDPAQRNLFGGETHAERAAQLRQPQQQRVLEVLLEAYPSAISHAELCERIGSNRASHRISELVDEGWPIEGSGVLPLDADTQTQLYRLREPFRGLADRKYAGFTLRWTEDKGLTVSVHRDCNGPIAPERLEAIANVLAASLAEELRDLIP